MSKQSGQYTLPLYNQLPEISSSTKHVKYLEDLIRESNELGLNRVEIRPDIKDFGYGHNVSIVVRSSNIEPGNFVVQYETNKKTFYNRELRLTSEIYLMPDMRDMRKLITSDNGVRNANMIFIPP